jgi:hypothetical protein
VTPRQQEIHGLQTQIIAIPVTVVDQVGFVADHDHTVKRRSRFVKLTPPGSACSINIGIGITMPDRDTPDLKYPLRPCHLTPKRTFLNAGPTTVAAQTTSPSR